MQENMKMAQLEYFGVPPYLIKIWQEHYSHYLLPVQEKAVRQYHLLTAGNHSLYQEHVPYCQRPKNLLIISPSSSGKTLLGEMAAIQEISLQKRVLFLVPLRILAEEKYRHFLQLYSSIGLNIKLSSRDHRFHDRDIIQGNFHIAILVYEKFYYLLMQYPECINNVSLIIADEIQLINDPERGPRLESSFNYFKKNYPNIRIIALSSFTEYLFPLAAWLDAELLFSSYRPVELRKGIVRKGIYKYIEHNSKIIGEEVFFPPEEVAEYDLASYLKATLHFLINRQESSLIFFSTRREVRLWSRWLATQFSLLPARSAITQLEALEDSTSKEELITLFQKGISYHCADLSWLERHAIEEAVRSGELKIVCATGTLAMGVNLPVNNVILTGQKITSKQENKDGLLHYYRKNLTFSEVENMGGRAGRLKTGNLFGRIIFLAPSLIEFTSYQKLYFQRYADDFSLPSLSYYPAIQQISNQGQSLVVSQVQENFISNNTSPAENDIANITSVNPFFPEIIKSNPVIWQQDILTFLLYKITLDGQSPEDIYQLFNTGKQNKVQTFWCYQFPRKYSESELRAYLQQLATYKLIDMPNAKDIQITELGQLITSWGISFQTYTHFLTWIEESQKGNISELEILFLIATSYEATLYFTEVQHKKSLLLKRREYLHLRILNLIFEQQEEGKVIFQNHLNINLLDSNLSDHNNRQRGKCEINNYLTINNLLIMYDWINNKELKDMEEEYGVLGGVIQRMGEGFSWLVDSLAALAEKKGWQEERLEDLKKIRQLSARLISGVKPEELDLAKLQIPGLTRGYIQRLVQEGYNNKDCLRELSKNQLQELLPDLLVKKIEEYLHSDSYLPGSELYGKLSKFSPLFSSQDSDDSKRQSINEHYQKLTKKGLPTVFTINLHRPDRIIFLSQEITVNKIGFQLICLLARNKGKVLSYEQIIDTLWPSDEDATYHRLWYHLAKLRNSFQQIMRDKNNNNFNLSEHYLKEKVFKVIPGRGLLLDSGLTIEWIE